MHVHTQARGHSDTDRPNVCLVVCPSTLVQHWAHEVNKFIDESAIRTAAYGGNPHERTLQQVCVLVCVCVWCVCV